MGLRSCLGALRWTAGQELCSAAIHHLWRRPAGGASSTLEAWESGSDRGLRARRIPAAWVECFGFRASDLGAGFH